MDKIETTTQVDENGAALGTLYDMNKQAYNAVFPLSDHDIMEVKSAISDWLKDNEEGYYLLLSNERRDYTFIKTDKNHSYTCAKEIITTLKNRGKILDCRFHTDAHDAYEFWIRDNIDKENYFFMLFPANDFIIDVTEE